MQSQKTTHLRFAITLLSLTGKGGLIGRIDGGATSRVERRKDVLRMGSGILIPTGGGTVANETAKVLPRIGVLTDFREERWPSMNLCGDMLLAHLPKQGPLGLKASRLCPPFRRLAIRLPLLGGSSSGLKADRILNRFVTYPRHAGRLAPRFDVFHVADHTYAQLVHVLPPLRTGVYCHDLDAFRCLIEPVAEPRPRWFRALARRILKGFEKAAVVFHGTAAVARQILRAGLVPADRLVYAPYGVALEFRPRGAELTFDLPWLANLGGSPWVLHIGSCIRRKRIDALLDIVARVREAVPDLRLVKVGGEWTADQRLQIARLGLAGAITHVDGLSRAELAEAYRRAPVVLMPSEAEGFGLPVIEALACGAPVVASDIPALCEAGGTAAVYAPTGDVSAWAEAVTRLVTDPCAGPPRAERLEWAARFSWKTHAETIAQAYHRIL